MYRCLNRKLTQDKKILIKRIKSRIMQDSPIHCRTLKRKVYLTKFVPSTITRNDCKQRLALFECALELIRNSSDITSTIINKQRHYAIRGLLYTDSIIEAHLREVVEEGNKQLYLISVFERKK